MDCILILTKKHGELRDLLHLEVTWTTLFIGLLVGEYLA